MTALQFPPKHLAIPFVELSTSYPLVTNSDRDSASLECPPGPRDMRRKPTLTPDLVTMFLGHWRLYWKPTSSRWRIQWTIKYTSRCSDCGETAIRSHRLTCLTRWGRALVRIAGDERMTNHACRCGLSYYGGRRRCLLIFISSVGLEIADIFSRFGVYDNASHSHSTSDLRLWLDEDRWAAPSNSIAPLERQLRSDLATAANDVTKHRKYRPTIELRRSFVRSVIFVQTDLIPWHAW